jgi:hypothetical protein
MHMKSFRTLFVACSFLIVWLIGGSGTLPGQNPVTFDDHFINKAMRIDYYHIGDAKEETITMDQIYQEKIWPGNINNLIDPFNNGRYAVKVYDAASNQLLYSRGFDCMFGEYKTTSPALNGVKRTFNRSVHIPFPKHPVIFAIEVRDKKNSLHPLFTLQIDPADYHIIKETTGSQDFVYEALINGDPHSKVDLAFMAEGYTSDAGDKFKADVDRFVGYLFETEPYKSAKNRFNIYGVFRPSPESALDEPRQGVFKNTTLNASFNAFDLDRYVLTEEGKRLRKIAAQVPYDTIVIMVNSKRYGGGGIYNDYCIAAVDSAVSKKLFLHEFGHSFTGLADEYYTSSVSYNDFYPKGIEPLEPNITALLNPDQVKWKDLLSPGIAIPTDWGKEKRESLQAEMGKNRQSMRKEIELAKQKGLSEEQIKKTEARFKKTFDDIITQLKEVRKQYSSLEDKVGVFEGAGYAAKGLYRPMIYCLMGSSPKDEYCLVCQKAIARMITYYSSE